MNDPHSFLSAGVWGDLLGDLSKKAQNYYRGGFSGREGIDWGVS